MERKNQDKHTVASILDLADNWHQTIADRGKAVQVSGGDLAPLRDPNRTTSPHDRLAAQIKDLDRLFIGLVQRAARCGDPQGVQMLLGLALRCQRQGMQSTGALNDLQQKPPRGGIVDVD